LTDEQLLDYRYCKGNKLLDDCTNTTISREGLKSDNKAEMGGLSGKP
jgi:dihydroorotate dehydrogenase